MNKLELIFKILAVILGGIAAFFLWKDDTDASFVTAVFGAVCFFLSIRFQVKERLKRREAETQREEGKMMG